MELTQEQKQQIEHEERQRLAEEQYRATVRAEIRGESSTPISWPPRRDVTQKSKSQIWLFFGIFSIVVTAVIFIAMGSADANRASTFAPSVRYLPTSKGIASGQVTVPAGGYVQYRFQITPEMRNPRVSGNFSASGGSGNDVAAIIATEAEYTNWINGHPAKAFYSTQGKKTIDSFDVSLPPGTYYFAVSNQFSTFSAKYVFVQADLKYSRMETY